MTTNATAATTATTYKIIRFYASPGRTPATIATSLTEDQARSHIQDPETSSETATSSKALHHTALYGKWFDAYATETE
jgi:hypothetical protein